MSNATASTASTLNITVEDVPGLSPEVLAAILAKHAGNKDFQKQLKETEKINAAKKKSAKKEFLENAMNDCGIEKTVAHSLQVSVKPSGKDVKASFNIQGFSGALTISVPNGRKGQMTKKQLEEKLSDAISLTLGMLEATASIYEGGEESEEETTEE